MEKIQVVLDAKLLDAVNTAAKKNRVSRSSLIRTALQEHLKRLHILELETQDRRGFQARPQQPDEYVPWEKVAVWPED